MIYRESLARDSSSTEEKISIARERITATGFDKIAVNCALASIIGATRLVKYHPNSPLGHNLQLKVKQGDNTFVTRADWASEGLMKRFLARSNPSGCKLIFEEGGISGQESELEFIGDPLDGTTEYAFGLPFAATTVMARLNNEPHAVAIASPFLREEGLVLAQKDLVYRFSLESDLSLNERIDPVRIRIPEPTRGRILVYIDSTIRNGTSQRVAEFIKNLPQITGMNISLIGTASNVQNQKLAILHGHAWITYAIGGRWDVENGAVMTKWAGGVATTHEGEEVTANSTSVVLGSCSEKVHAMLLPLAQSSFTGYKDFKTG